MQSPFLRRTCAALLVSSSLLVPAAWSQIAPAGITGTGTYFNSAALLIDGVVPAETTWWTDATNTYWDTNGGASFTIDLGGTFKLFDAVLSVDNNDDYKLEYSLDGSSYATLLYIAASAGEIPASPGGMDTFATNAGHPEYEASLAFAPTDARYLRLSALNGDGLFAAGEVQVWGREIGGAVPEPSTYGVIGAVALAGLAWRKRRLARR